MSDFHFIEPLWWLALIPLGLLLWWAWHADAGASAWQRIVDARLLAVLRVGAGESARQWPLRLLAAGWLLAVLALANPTFEREPVPAFRGDAARVVVLDLSRSMLAEDLTPSRLERARYKVADILDRSAHGQVGLVVFADDAFAVAPLTDDAETIRAMLETLSPQIMPVQGSRPERGLDLALELLQQAGARNGEVILLTDDAGGSRGIEAAKRVREAGHGLGVIGVGSAEGAPVPGVTSADGPVLARLDAAALERLARAGAGRYADLDSSDRDLERILSDASARRRALAERDPLLAERWRELGPWITVLLVPLAALAFRRGWLAILLCTLAPGALMLPQPALALSWADLWQRPEQQAAQAFAAGELERARELATDAALAGSAAYRLGDYAQAAAAFAADDSATAHYNRGNALAREGELEAALDAYDQALARDPGLADARHNRAQVKAALQAQTQQPSPQDRNGGARGASEESQEAEDERQPGDSGGDAGSDTGSDAGSDAGGDKGGDENGGQSGNASEEASAEPQRSAGHSAADQPREATDSAAASSGTDQDSAAASANGESGSSAQRTPADANAHQSGDREAQAPSEEAQAAPKDAPGPPAGSPADAEQGEQAAADYRDEAARADAAERAERAERRGDRQDEAMDDGARQGLADAASAEPALREREARQAADQWLRRIPDDPAELLRRKFLYQYQTRQRGADQPPNKTPW
ncbi:MAG: VWA domain-containing protein [Halochromatium sp.]